MATIHLPDGQWHYPQECASSPDHRQLEHVSPENALENYVSKDRIKSIVECLIEENGTNFYMDDYELGYVDALIDALHQLDIETDKDYFD